jgi:glycosyltransferase involved in cell wall biosynthesis
VVEGSSASGVTQAAIVLTCFDAGDTLLETVASIRDERAELVIVDDGSTDERTRAILQGLEQEGFNVVHRPNGGLSAALMTGVEATTSPYIFRFDSDDLLEPGAVHDLAAALDAHPRAAAAWGDLQTFGLTALRVPSVPVLDPWHVTYATVLPASSMFRRAALLDVGGWQLRGGYEDWDVWMALAEHGYAGVYVPRVVYRYRREREGLLFESLTRYDDHYEELRRRHTKLFDDRALNRRRSPAPRVLKTLLPRADRVSRLSRLQKVWLAQVLTHLFWNGGIRVTSRMIAQGISARSGVRRLRK